MIRKIIIAILYSLVISFNCTAEDIDLFYAEKENRISINFIASNEKTAKIIIENKTDKPLTIKLPRSFIAVPVLAQVGFNNGGIQPGINGRDAGFNNGGITSNFQRTGGGFNQNPFALKPGSRSIINVNTVCIDYGYKVPNARIKYKIIPVDDNPKLDHIFTSLAKNHISQDIAQVCAWHISNNIPLKEIGIRENYNYNTIVSAQRFIDNI